MTTKAHEQFLTVSKTARYYTLGKLGANTKEIWIVLHGYAQLASDFIQPFSTINDGSRFIVAPEGLNKFYAKGFGGKPAASWMTSEMREYEIRDYIHYLDTLYRELPVHVDSCDIILLGFSQGVATATRWFHHTTNRVDRLVLFAGEVAAELREPLSPKLTTVPITYVTGDNDRLISPEKLTEVKLFMRSLNAQIIEFSGGHELHPDALKKLISGI